MISFGVVEHFDNTSQVLSALSKYLKEGGLLVTSIPNMAGSLGFIQKRINRPIFDIHNPLDRDELRNANKNAGYEDLECGYFMSTNFGVCNLNGISRNGVGWMLKRIALVILARLSMLVWLIESKLGAFPRTKMFSPHIISIARKPSSQDHIDTIAR